MGGGGQEMGEVLVMFRFFLGPNDTMRSVSGNPRSGTHMLRSTFLNVYHTSIKRGFSQWVSTLNAQGKGATTNHFLVSLVPSNYFFYPKRQLWSSPEPGTTKSTFSFPAPCCLCFSYVPGSAWGTEDTAVTPDEAPAFFEKTGKYAHT